MLYVILAQSGQTWQTARFAAPNGSQNVGIFNAMLAHSQRYMASSFDVEARMEVYAH